MGLNSSRNVLLGIPFVASLAAPSIITTERACAANSFSANASASGRSSLWTTFQYGGTTSKSGLTTITRNIHTTYIVIFGHCCQHTFDQPGDNSPGNSWCYVYIHTIAYTVCVHDHK